MSNFAPPIQHAAAQLAPDDVLRDEEASHHHGRHYRAVENALHEGLGGPTPPSPITSELDHSFSDDVAMNIQFRHMAEAADLDEDPKHPNQHAGAGLATNLGVGVNVPVAGVNVNAEVMTSLPGHAASRMDDLGVAPNAEAPVAGDTRVAPTAPLTPAVTSMARNAAHSLLPNLVAGTGPTATAPVAPVPASLDEALRHQHPTTANICTDHDR